MVNFPPKQIGPLLAGRWLDIRPSLRDSIAGRLELRLAEPVLRRAGSGEGSSILRGLTDMLREGSSPETARRGVRDSVWLIRLFNEEQAAPDKLQIQIGIGIASGQVVAGYTGTQHRATYTCVGDTVNVAARLESHTKVVNRPILIDEHTTFIIQGTDRSVICLDDHFGLQQLLDRPIQ